VAQPVKAVTFDFWNTIVRAPAGLMNEARRRAIVDACEECGVEQWRDRPLSALHDDPDVDGAIEAGFILDSHSELPDLVDRFAAR
jgi:hypothetical protein